MESFDLLIAGCGVSGKAAARLASLQKKNFAILDESADPEIHRFAASLNHPPAAVFAPWDKTAPLPALFRTAVLSPGIRRGGALFQTIQAASGHLTGELDFAAESLKCPLTAITGTNGKTTTTELTNALFQAIGDRSCAGGNIGSALSDGAIAFLNGEVDRLVIEVSSFQMESSSGFPVESAALLNLASDHTDRHGSPEEYAAIKFRLLRSAERAAVLNSLLRKTAKHFLPSSLPVITFSATENNADFTLDHDGRIRCHGKPVFDFRSSPLLGAHNAENIMAALALLSIAHGEEILQDERIAQALRTFRPDAHRLETFLTWRGIRFVDDSKATNPHAVNAALRTLSAPAEGKNIRILLGGLDKRMDFSELRKNLACVKHACLTGPCAAGIENAIGDLCPCTQFDSFDQAVRAMCENANPGEIVLLSPGAASMDAFRNYRERGERFQNLVLKYTAGNHFSGKRN